MKVGGQTVKIIVILNNSYHKNSKGDAFIKHIIMHYPAAA